MIKTKLKLDRSETFCGVIIDNDCVLYILKTLQERFGKF